MHFKMNGERIVTVYSIIVFLCDPISIPSPLSAIARQVMV